MSMCIVSFNMWGNTACLPIGTYTLYLKFCIRRCLKSERERKKESVENAYAYIARPNMYVHCKRPHWQQTPRTLPCSFIVVGPSTLKTSIKPTHAFSVSNACETSPRVVIEFIVTSVIRCFTTKRHSISTEIHTPSLTITWYAIHVNFRLVHNRHWVVLNGTVNVNILKENNENKQKICLRNWWI